MSCSLHSAELPLPMGSAEGHLGREHPREATGDTTLKIKRKERFVCGTETSINVLGKSDGKI